MNRLKALIALMALVFAAGSASAAEDIRTLDTNCRYVKRMNGQPLTYRETLNIAVQTFSNSSAQRDLKENVNKYIPWAMELFGAGPISRNKFKDAVNSGFHYNGVVCTKSYFLSDLSGLELPFQATEEATNYSGNPCLYEIRYALFDILSHNACQSKAGDI